MGGWIGISCNCEDRNPVSRDTKHTCGHDSGLLMSMPLFDALLVGHAIYHAFDQWPAGFEVFAKICGVENYNDELLMLSPEQAAIWRLEVEQLQRYLSGSPPMEWKAAQRWKDYWRFPGGWIGEKQMSRIEMLQDSGRDLPGLLADMIRLCDCSEASGMPIECRQ